MQTFEFELEYLLTKLESLEVTTTPTWGEMSAQRMVEHLCDALYMSCGIGTFELEVPEDRIEKMQLFLASDKPMAQNIRVSFANAETPVRNENMELALDEFATAFVDFMETFEENPSFTALHPFYGVLDYEKWNQLHAKHFAHHFKQFGLID
jgi:hydroxymethylglutaryl-CoA reductase